MSPQLSLIYQPKHVGSETWDAERESIRAAVSHLGAKEVAFELDVSGSALSDALNERDRKRWAGEWSHIVIAMLNRRASSGDEVAADCLATITRARIGIAPFDVLEQQPLNDKELAAAALAELAKYGDAGKQSIARLKRGRP